jgi:F-type H+-transporting ATPase subunit b
MEAILPKSVEVLVSLLSFLVLFTALWKFAFPPITDMLEKRSETIRDGLERAESAKIEAERLLEEYKKTIAEARKEAGVILQQAKKAAELTRVEATEKTQAEIDGMLAKARESIEGERRAAVASLQASVADLSVAVAGKIIGSELSREDHLGVIEKYVREAGSLNAN